VHVRQKFGASERRACRVLGQVRSTQRRPARRRPDEEALRSDVVKLASRYGRYGYRRVTALLRAEGWPVNHKRVERIWRQEDLKVPKRQPRRGRPWLNDGSCVRLRPKHRGHVWSYDFTMARTHDGRPLRMLTVLDEYSRECLAIVVERELRSDNGPEFTAKVVRTWLKRVGVRTLFIEPGSPRENGYNESLNGKLKDELVNREIFYSLKEAQVLVEQSRREYDTVRPHSSLGYRPPAPQAVRPVRSWLRRPALQGPGLAAGLT
jgi:transposase InsO family protein